MSAGFDIRVGLEGLLLPTRGTPRLQANETVGVLEQRDWPTLADFFSILLAHESFEKRIPFGPFTMPAVGIDVPRLADIDEGAPPSSRTMFGMGQRSERVIRAGDHEAPKGERDHRHRDKSTRRGREACALRIGHRHEKRALRN